MIERKQLLALSFYEKSPFTGSDGKLRYRIEKLLEDDTKMLLATAWFGIFAFDHTPDDEKQTFKADFSEDGMEQIINWLSFLCAKSQHEAHS